MNVLTSTWHQLVRRRLWPVAVLLLAALAAVPVVLARTPETPVPPVVPAEAVTAKAGDEIAEPVVAEVTPEDRSRRRRVLGARKDPFRPAPVKKAKVDAPKPAPQLAPKPDTGSSLPSTGGSVSIGGGSVPVPVAPVAPVAPKTYYSPGTIIVRFGDARGDQAAKFAVKKLKPVPDHELPLLIYMGLTKDGKRAKFLVDASVEVDGDGTCKPHPSSCETVELSVGETEFLDVIDPDAAEDADDEDRIAAQYQLDLVDIKRAGDADVK